MRLTKISVLWDSSGPLTFQMTSYLVPKLRAAPY